MEYPDNYKPKFDPETGLPLSDTVADVVSEVPQSISESTAAATQSVRQEAPFQADEATGAYTSSEPAAAVQAPFQAVSTDSSYQSPTAAQTQAPFQAVYQDTSSQAPFQAAPTQAPYQAAPTQAPYQAAPTQAPYQAAPSQAPYQAAPSQAPQGSGIQYSNQANSAPHGSGVQYSNQANNAPYQANQAGNVAPSNTLALVSLIAGIVSVVFIFLSGSIILGILGIAAGIAAVITGTMALKQIKTQPASSSSKGMATAGIICGAIGLVLSLIVTIACAACYASFGGLAQDALETLEGFNP